MDWSEKEEPGARRGSLRSPRRQDPGISAPTQADGPSIGSIDGAGRADVATFVSEAGIRHTSGCQSNSRSVVCAGRSQHLLGMASGGQCRRSRRLAEAVLSLKDAGVPSFLIEADISGLRHEWFGPLVTADRGFTLVPPVPRPVSTGCSAAFHS